MSVASFSRLPRQTSISGSFKGATFLNKMLDPPADETEEREEIVISEEYDRVYKGVNDCVRRASCEPISDLCKILCKS